MAVIACDMLYYDSTAAHVEECGRARLLECVSDYRLGRFFMRLRARPSAGRSASTAVTRASNAVASWMMAICNSIMVHPLPGKVGGTPSTWGLRRRAVCAFYHSIQGVYGSISTFRTLEARR